MAGVSKNQRSGPKQVQRDMLCAQGHKMNMVLLAGHGTMWLCRCDDEKLLKLGVHFGCACHPTPAGANIGAYMQIKPDGLPGKAREGVKGGEARWTGND